MPGTVWEKCSVFGSYPPLVWPTHANECLIATFAGKLDLLWRLVLLLDLCRLRDEVPRLMRTEVGARKGGGDRLVIVKFGLFLYTPV